jgi:cysteinyl-tRNA synthetase
MSEIIKSILIVVIIISYSCNKEEGNLNPEEINYKEEMREFVIGISQTAKTVNSKFLVIPQNGIELVTQNGANDGSPHSKYLNSIDANGQEDLFYGYVNDDDPTPDDDKDYLKSFLNISKNHGNIVLVTDYCYTHTKMEDSYNQNSLNGYISFAADHRELDNIPAYPDSPYSENIDNIHNISQIKNFLYLINPQNYNSKSDFINAVASTNYDLVILDLFFNDGTEFTSSEIDQMKSKANGSDRLLICYMSIGEAEKYRYYWKQEWNTDKPVWLDRENPDWEGNYKVKYWNKDWQNIIYGDSNSYLTKILDAGFDGVYLDIIDAFEFYE